MKENHRHSHEDGTPQTVVGSLGAIAIQFKIQNDQFKMKENHRHSHENGNPAIAVGNRGAIAINSKFKMKRITVIPMKMGIYEMLRGV